MSNAQVVGVGALNMDYLYKVERILDDGETVVKESTLSPGGSAANTIYGLTKLGVKTGFAGIVGDDADGRILLADFHKTGVDTSHIKIRSKTKTGSVFCLNDNQGKRSLYVLPGVNSLLTMDDLDLDYINQAEIVHISSFADDRQFKVSLELMGKLNPSIKVSFAPGALYTARGLKALSPILKMTHVLFINQNEIQQLTGQGIIDGTESCLKQGCKIVAITLGKGLEIKTITATSYIRDANSEYIIEQHSRKALSTVDTTGAGDAFAAGFLYGLINTKPLDECGSFGDTVAQLSVTKSGAREGLPTLTELNQHYRAI